MRAASPSRWDSRSQLTSNMSDVLSTIQISKLDAARRQLRTAITLWFNGGDPVSIHTLAFAAYEIVHAVSKKRDPDRPNLIFDSAVIRDDERREFKSLIKKHAAFFKHADHDPEGVIPFNPEVSEIFMTAAVYGLLLCKEFPQQLEELAYMLWFQYTKPELLTPEFQKQLAAVVPVQFEQGKQLPKCNFFKHVLGIETDRPQ